MGTRSIGSLSLSHSREWNEEKTQGTMSYMGQEVGEKKGGERDFQGSGNEDKSMQNFTPLYDTSTLTKHQGMEAQSRCHNLECKVYEEGNSDSP